MLNRLVGEEQLRLDYRLKGVGWSEADLFWGRRQVRLTASDLGDALGDLVRAAVAVGGGASAARVTWAEEPGRYCWKFDRYGADVELEIWSYRDSPAVPVEEDGRLIFRGECPVSDACRAVAVAAHRVLDIYGVAGYSSGGSSFRFPRTTSPVSTPSSTASRADRLDRSTPSIALNAAGGRGSTLRGNARPASGMSVRPHAARQISAACMAADQCGMHGGTAAAR